MYVSMQAHRNFIPECSYLTHFLYRDSIQKGAIQLKNYSTIQIQLSTPLM